MEDSRIGDKKLLVAWSDKRCGKICGGMQLMLEDEEQDRGTGGKVKVE